ncbi:MAG: helix-turn-helix transcriptional regulator [Lachnospiraceae bacterium]|nr:helix-turn-helix transcriptional regulator [Lachnospiraceae bacterium]
MEHYKDRFDFHGLGLAIKDAREKKGWTQEYLAELVGRTSHTIMNIENKRQCPSFGVFVKLVSMFDISVDQFIHSDSRNRESLCRKHIDVLLNTMNEKELVVMEATAEGLKNARETEVSG